MAPSKVGLHASRRGVIDLRGRNPGIANGVPTSERTIFGMAFTDCRRVLSINASERRDEKHVTSDVNITITKTRNRIMRRILLAIRVFFLILFNRRSPNKWPKRLAAEKSPTETPAGAAAEEAARAKTAGAERGDYAAGGVAARGPIRRFHPGIAGRLLPTPRSAPPPATSTAIAARCCSGCSPCGRP